MQKRRNFVIDYGMSEFLALCVFSQASLYGPHLMTFLGKHS